MENIEKQVEEYTNNIISHLKNKWGKVDESWTGLLVLLTNHYKNFLLASEAVKTDGLIINGNRGLYANPAVTIQKDATTKINQIVDLLGISPKGESKIKATENDDDDYIGQLINE